MLSLQLRTYYKLLLLFQQSKYPVKIRLDQQLICCRLSGAEASKFLQHLQKLRMSILHAPYLLWKPALVPDRIENRCLRIVIFTEIQTFHRKYK